MGGVKGGRVGGNVIITCGGGGGGCSEPVVTVIGL